MMLSERFWNKVEKVPHGCWIWKGAKTRDGYGLYAISHKDPTLMVHRSAYESLVGKIPENLTIHHKCNNRACVNPTHLEVMTLRENILLGNSCAAKNARKTHCPQGHELKGDNLVQFDLRRGIRRCRACAAYRGSIWQKTKRIHKIVRF